MVNTKIIQKNIAFIDGQNLYWATRESGWKISFPKFKFYLDRKYNAMEVFYFMGVKRKDEQAQKLYGKIEGAGFTLMFRMHDDFYLSSKKGNVDTDIVFEMMKNIIDNKDFDRIVLISGDGDYYKTVEFLIKKGKFLKILFPSNRNYSSLYKKISATFYSYLDEPDVKKKIELIERQNEKANLGS